VAREPREAATARVQGAVQARRGDVLDFKMFSNLALDLLVELEAAELVGATSLRRVRVAVAGRRAICL
jgi:hypothetical protein